jgi:Flp pilus assembly protein TadD
MKKYLPILALLLALPACTPAAMKGDPVDSLSGKADTRNARRATAAAAAIAAGRTGEALSQYEDLHEARPRDPLAAVNYAQLLRRTGKAEKAKAVLDSYMTEKTARGLRAAHASPLVRNEYAATLIALGDFARAETILNGVLSDPDAADFTADTQDLLGVALDAQGKHKDAEVLFRTALKSWTGDPSPVLNNLGLCLANQGRRTEALATLRRALLTAPRKDEIAANIARIEKTGKSAR